MALLIEGARRIGKSYIVEEFARREYDSYLMVDFSKVNPQVMEFFDIYLGSLIRQVGDKQGDDSGERRGTDAALGGTQTVFLQQEFEHIGRRENGDRFSHSESQDHQSPQYLAYRGEIREGLLALLVEKVHRKIRQPVVHAIRAPRQGYERGGRNSVSAAVHDASAVGLCQHEKNGSANKFADPTRGGSFMYSLRWWRGGVGE